MATTPVLVVAGNLGVARTLRETGRFPAVFEAASAAELRDLSKSGRVRPPAAFMFGSGFVEDLPGARVPTLANGLVSSGFTVLVHPHFLERGDSFVPDVRVVAGRLRLSELLALLNGDPPPDPPTPTFASAPVPTPSHAPEPMPAPVYEPAPVFASVAGQALASPEQSDPPYTPAMTAQPGTTWHQSAPPRAAQGHPASPDVTWDSTAQPDTAWPPSAPPHIAQDHTTASEAAGGLSAAPYAAQPETAWDQSPLPQAARGLAARRDAATEFTARADAEHDLSTAAQDPVWSMNGWTDSPAPPASTAAGVPRERGRVVAVAAAKGGVGKTSATVNLAVFAARVLQAAGRGGRAVLVDANFQQADVARYLNLDRPTILDMLRAPGAVSATTVRHKLAHIPEIDLYVLLGPPEAVHADPALINPRLYQGITAVLREAFDFIFLDTPVAELYHTTFTELVLPEADAILVPVEPNRVTLEAAGSWLKAITQPQHSRNGGVDPEKISLILNRARADVLCDPEDVMDLLPGRRFIGMIPEDQEWMGAVNDHRLIGLRPEPKLETTFRHILEVVTGDPIFTTAALEAPASDKRPLLSRMLGLTPKKKADQQPHGMDILP